MNTQLSILADSLDQKILILEDISRINAEQETILKSDDSSMEEFDRTVDAKDALIDKLTLLDEGFEALYARIADELKDNRAKYADDIKALQEKVAKVTELSVSVQAEEARNKQLVEALFRKSKDGIKQSRKSAKAAFDYYKSMSGANYPRMQQVDSKK